MILLAASAAETNINWRKNIKKIKEKK